MKITSFIASARFRRIALLTAICCFALACCACSGFSALWTVGDVALGAVSVAVASITSVIGASVADAINSEVSKVQALWVDLKAAVSAYTSNAANGTLAAVQAVIASIQAALPAVEAVANIGNPIVAAVIAAVVNAVGAVLTYLANNVVPSAETAKAEFAVGNHAKAQTLDDGMKAEAIVLRGKFEGAIAASGLDADTVNKINAHMEHQSHLHVGPLRF